MSGVLHPLLASSATVNWLTGWKFTGNFTIVDLTAASTNGNSQRELRDLGLLVEGGDRDGQIPATAGTH